ncbi:hypothetical protein ZIOFF_071708 [Zingiber officinale]|uniref:Uncharacterized protein n=1 Tax=Zingiber officinale TaxID=94328 RepID=A0A8J5CUW2_ZINOF|nr:hypothetical protein ZIOFF_071708 [Zingiber officinale]
MEASTRLLGSTAAFHLQLRTIALPALSIPLSNPNHPRFPLVSSSPIPSIAFPRCSRPAFQCAVDGPFGSRPPFSSLSFSRLFGSIYSKDRAVVSGPGYKEGSFRWENDQKITEGGDPGFANEKGAIWTVVLLGWLGAELKHLNKYAMLYSSLGIRPVRFVVPVKELLGFDLGRRVEEKIACFTQELVSWCSETEKDGRERCLLFHSFSNTVRQTILLVYSYGSILENLQNRPDIVQKIKGCIVDSGAAPEISPQIWAAGFSAALLKKRSSLVYSSTNGEVTNMDVTISGLEHKDNNFSFKETFLLSLLEKFFIVVLVLPDVNLDDNAAHDFARFAIAQEALLRGQHQSGHDASIMRVWIKPSPSPDYSTTIYLTMDRDTATAGLVGTCTHAWHCGTCLVVQAQILCGLWTLTCDLFNEWTPGCLLYVAYISPRAGATVVSLSDWLFNKQHAVSALGARLGPMDRNLTLRSQTVLSSDFT